MSHGRGTIAARTCRDPAGTVRTAPDSPARGSHENDKLMTFAVATRQPFGAAHDPRTTRRLAVGLAFAFAITAIGLLASAGPTYAWDASSFSSSSERELVSLTNQARAARGLRALRVDSTLTSVARWRSKDMIVKNYFSHNIPPSGKMVFSVLDSKGYCYSLAGENIGWNNYSDDIATREIQKMFMGSTTHRANILNKRWDVIGIGAYKGANGKKMWTVLFADKCGGTAPKPAATPKPKAVATPKPKATPKPTPKATPKPTPTPTPTPIDVNGLGFGPGGKDDNVTNNGNGGSSGGGAPPGQGGDKPANANSTSLRVVDESVPNGLFETIVGDVTGSYLGG
jgi:uncharacterized protein YkwD